MNAHVELYKAEDNFLKTQSLVIVTLQIKQPEKIRKYSNVCLALKLQVCMRSPGITILGNTNKSNYRNDVLKCAIAVDKQQDN